MYVCLCEFSNVDTTGWGVVPIPVEMKERDQGAVTKYLSHLLVLGG